MRGPICSSRRRLEGRSIRCFCSVDCEVVVVDGAEKTMQMSQCTPGPKTASVGEVWAMRGCETSEVLLIAVVNVTFTAVM